MHLYILQFIQAIERIMFFSCTKFDNKLLSNAWIIDLQTQILDMFLRVKVIFRFRYRNLLRTIRFSVSSL